VEQGCRKGVSFGEIPMKKSSLKLKVTNSKQTFGGVKNDTS
jgi:hypothetical protein